MSYSVYLRGKPCEGCARSADINERIADLEKERDDLEHGEHDPYCPDPTYNLTPIFDLALTGGDLPNAGTSEVAVVLLKEQTDRPRGLRLLSGKTGTESLVLIKEAIARLVDSNLRECFVALEPPNKWGTLADAAETYPDNTWEIS